MQKFPCRQDRGWAEQRANLAPHLARSLRKAWGTKQPKNQAGRVAGWLDGVRAGLLVCWLAASKKTMQTLHPKIVYLAPAVRQACTKPFCIRLHYTCIM